MEKPVKVKKTLRLSEADKKVLRDYADMSQETGLRAGPKTSSAKEFHMK